MNRTVEAAEPGLVYRVVLPLGVFALLVCLRMPQIVINGRFWAEEGHIFFHNAWTQSPVQALFTSYGGYLNLAANAATLAARWLVPLRLAPYITVGTALVVQLFPPLLVLTARDAWLRPVHVRLAACLALLLVPASDEVWLQTLHSQFELALCCALILGLEVDDGRISKVRLGILFLAPLCGVVAIAVLPLFVVCAAIERSRGRAVQAAFLGAGAAIQMLFFFHAIEGRAYRLDPLVMLDVVTLRHLEVPFFGLQQASEWAMKVQTVRANGGVALLCAVLPVATFGPVLVCSLLCARGRVAFWYLCAGGLMAGASYFGALGGVETLMDIWNGERYGFAPQALFALSFVTLAATTAGWVRRLSWIAVIWLLFVGQYEYRRPWVVASSGPSWRAEVEAWQKGENRVLRTWPTGWTVDLGPYRPGE